MLRHGDKMLPLSSLPGKKEKIIERVSSEYPELAESFGVRDSYRAAFGDNREAFRRRLPSACVLKDKGDGCKDMWISLRSGFHTPVPSVPT